MSSQSTIRSYSNELVDSYYMLLWYLDDILERNSSEEPKIIEFDKRGVKIRYRIVPKPTAHIADARDNYERMRRGLWKLLNTMLYGVKRFRLDPDPDDAPTMRTIKMVAKNFGGYFEDLAKALADDDMERSKREIDSETQKVVVALLDLGEEASKFATLKELSLGELETLKTEAMDTS